jgi:hypothetical protein
MHPTHVLVVGQKTYNENGGDTQAFLDGNNGPQQQHGLSGCNSFSLTSLIFSFLQVVFQDSHSFLQVVFEALTFSLANFLIFLIVHPLFLSPS